MRQKQGLPLRKVAAAVDIDPSTLGKFEKNTRNPSKEVIGKLSDFYSVDFEKLYIQAASDRIVSELKNERLSFAIIKAAEKKLKQKQ